MGAPAPKTLEYESKKVHLSDQVDAIFMHKIWGFVVFGAIMGLLFVSIFWFAAPLMDGIQALVGKLGGIVANWLPEGPIHDLWTDGIVAGVGAVVVFVPQIAILFMFLAILEDSGYLARAAFLMDRVLAKVGLQGKSFIPLLSSFACAIPGIMATRTIEDRKSRLATIFVAPFMSCSARLPVYTLLIGTFFGTFSPAARGGIMLSLYALGIFAAAGTAWLFKRSMLKGPIPAFILEMPSYKVPQLSQVIRAVYMNTGEFLKKAGTTIFVLSVILWALTYYPRLPGMNDGSRREQWLIDTVSQLHIEGAKLMVSTTAQYPGSDKWENVQQAVASGKEASAIVGNSSLNGAEKLAQLWAITNPDARPTVENAADQAVASEQLRYSFAGRFGHMIEPVIKPLGFDWKMGVGLVGAFAAREVFVSTMGIVYSVGDVGDETTPLSDIMRADKYPNGKPVWTPLVAVSLLVWFVLAMQCMSTLAIVRRETGGWRWPLAMLFYMNTLAYVVSLLIYQVGRIWFA
jgi:ferrous iron transport protein B